MNGNHEGSIIGILSVGAPVLLNVFGMEMGYNWVDFFSDFTVLFKNILIGGLTAASATVISFYVKKWLNRRK